MSIRKINTAILNQVKLNRSGRMPVSLPNKPSATLAGLEKDDKTLDSAAKAGKKLAKLFWRITPYALSGQRQSKGLYCQFL